MKNKTQLTLVLIGLGILVTTSITALIARGSDLEYVWYIVFIQFGIGIFLMFYPLTKESDEEIQNRKGRHKILKGTAEDEC